jgi:hypothetical protein
LTPSIPLDTTLKEADIVFDVFQAEFCAMPGRGAGRGIVQPGKKEIVTKRIYALEVPWKQREQ